MLTYSHTLSATLCMCELCESVIKVHVYNTPVPRPTYAWRKFTKVEYYNTDVTTDFSFRVAKNAIRRR